MILYYKEAAAGQRGKTSLKSLKDVKIYVIETSAASKQVANDEENHYSNPKTDYGNQHNHYPGKYRKTSKGRGTKIYREQHHGTSKGHSSKIDYDD